MAGAELDVPPDWETISERVWRKTTLIVGPPSAGKSTLTAFVAHRLRARGERVGLVTGDPGQPSFGLPTCVAAAVGGAELRWFVGASSPAGNLLPTAIGVGRLADWARAAGAGTVLVDASGLLAGQVARVLAAHTLAAARATICVAVGEHPELFALAALLQTCGARVVRTLSPGARERSAAERRAARNALFASAFAGSRQRHVDARRIVGDDWIPLWVSPGPRVEHGCIAGAIDEDGFCRGLGVVIAADHHRAIIETPLDHPEAAARIQLGRLRLEPHRGYEEVVDHRTR